MVVSFVKGGTVMELGHDGFGGLVIGELLSKVFHAVSFKFLQMDVVNTVVSWEI